MNLRDEMQYDFYKVLERYVKPGLATSISKVLAQNTFDSLMDKWRQVCKINIQQITAEELEKMGYVKKENDTV